MRSPLWYLFPLAAGYIFPLIAPRVLPFAVLLAVISAIMGARRAEGNAAAVVRSAVFAASTFAYPFFLGNTVFAWVGIGAAAALFAAEWRNAANHHLIATAQTLGAGLGVSVAVSGAQFFFPVIAGWAALSGTILFGALVAAFSDVAPLRIIVATLLLSEMIIVTRMLPVPWLIAGTALAFAFAVLIIQRRFLRFGFTSMLVAILVAGVLPR